VVLKHFFRILLCFFVFTTFAKAQTIDSLQLSAVFLLKSLKEKPKGFFVEDSIQIGLPVSYSLSLKHPSNIQVLFPDSNYNFYPFELLDKKYFFTKTNEEVSVDSVVYTLTTFEIFSQQRLQLPIFIVSEIDCTAVYPRQDTVFLQELVKGNIDSLSLKTETTLQATQEYFDYPLLITFFIAVLIVAFIFWLFLGRNLTKRYRLYQYTSRQQKFIKDFNRLTMRIRIKQSVEDIEKAVTIWKNHLEFLENRPYSTYTSKEIRQQIPNNDLAESLKYIDRAIYGKEMTDQVEKSLNTLRDFSVFRFDKKQKELQNG